MLRETEQRRVIRIIGVVQFVVAVDFMMILPLGPDLTAPLGFPPSSLGLVIAAYTAAAAFAGVAGAIFLDRFNRRTALTVGLVALALSALGASFATGLPSLMFARAAAGLFGGPVSALALSALTDAIPAASRGRAMGKVMGANALGAILGVPIGLWLADAWRWEGPFWAVGLVGVGAAGLVAFGLPRLETSSVAPSETGLRTMFKMIARGEVALTYLMIFGIMGTSFLLTPNLSAFVQNNLHYPRTSIPGLYFIAGTVSFVTMRWVGSLVDRRGAFPVGIGAAIGFIATVVIYLILPSPILPVPIGFVLLLVSLSSRNVAVRTITTQIPAPHERARFLSLESSVRYLAAASGALASSAMLQTRKDGTLVGMDILGWIVIAAAVTVLPLLAHVEAAAKNPHA